MGIARGTNIVTDSLVYGHDSGYNVADNNTATRFYPGEPTTNITPLTDFITTSNWTGGGWQGSIAVSSDYSNTLELTAYNGWRTFAINHGITSGGTLSVSFQYRLKSFQTMTVFGIVLNGRNLGNYHNDLGQITNSNLRDSQSGWKTFNGSFTANNNTYGGELCIGLRGSDNGGNTEVMYIRELQVELKPHQTPYASSTRSDTASLIDLTRTTNIDVGDASFDSTGQPDLDGTGDFIKASSTHGITGDITLEGVFNEDASSSPHTTVICTDTGHQYGVKLMAFKNTSRYGLWLGFGSSSHVAMVDGSFSNNTTYHLAASWDQSSGVVKIYLNGVLKSTQSTGQTSAVSLNEAKVVVGADYHSLSYGLNGKVYVGKVYNKVLTDAEVTQNYRAYKNRFNL